MDEANVLRVTRNLGLTALAVGSLIIGKRYYEQRKLRNWAQNYINETDRRYNNCFIIDRLIDPNCDGKPLSIGINTNQVPLNLMSRQGIRLGEDGNIKHLVSFLKVNNGLVYNFEDNTNLTLTKNEKSNKITYSFQTTGKTVVKEMDDSVINRFKTIGMDSKELDSIAELK